MTTANFSRLRRLLLLGFAAVGVSAHAQLSIEVTGAGANRIPVTIADFGGEPGLSRAITSVIRGDLERSGLFKMIEQAQPSLTEASSIDLAAARGRGADAIAAGIGTAVERSRAAGYLPWFWRWIMPIILHIPEWLFKRLKL